MNLDHIEPGEDPIEWIYYEGCITHDYEYGLNVGYAYHIDNDHWPCDNKGERPFCGMNRVYGRGFETKKDAKMVGERIADKLGIKVKWITKD